MTKRPTPPEQQSQVETTKIDPKEFLDQALSGTAGGAAPRSAAEGDRELEPFDLRNVPNRDAVANAKARQEAEKAKDAVETMLPPEAEKSVLEENLKGDTISRLEERFGMKPEVLHEVTIEASGQTLGLSMRLPLYDDFIWAVADVTSKAERGEDLSLLSTEEQRSQMLQHLSSCRCVMKIDGEWIWDVFDYRGAIQQMSPNWDGESYIKIPDAFMGTLARRVYHLFRFRLHPDILFETNNCVTRLLEEFGPSRVNAKDEEKKNSKDPTSAP